MSVTDLMSIFTDNPTATARQILADPPVDCSGKLHEGPCFEDMPVNASGMRGWIPPPTNELPRPAHDHITITLPTWQHAERSISGDRTTDQTLKTALETFIGDWSPVVADEERMFRHGLARVLAEKQLFDQMVAKVAYSQQGVVDESASADDEAGRSRSGN